MLKRLTMKKYDLYTDTGGTFLADGSKYDKNDMLVEAIGCIDEVNSYLGIIYAQLFYSDLKRIIDQIQQELCEINAVLSNAHISYDAAHVAALEMIIKHLEPDLSPLQHFLLSGSGIISAHLQYARALVRTAERRVGSLDVSYPQILPYLNRLSDVLFLMARTVDQRTSQPERLWKQD